MLRTRTFKLSPTGINTYRKCPRKFYFYINRYPTTKPAFEEALELGRIVHKVIAHYYEIIPQDIVPGEVRTWAQKALFDVTVNLELPQEIRDRIDSQIENFVRFEEKRLSWHMNPKPIAIEKEYVKDCVHGIVDAVFRKDDKVIVVDWKTGRGHADLTDDIIVQLNVYMWLTGADEAYALFLEYGAFRKLTRTFDIGEIVQMIKEDKLFAPRRGDHCKWCEYQIVCLMMDGGVSVDESLWWHEE